MNRYTKSNKKNFKVFTAMTGVLAFAIVEQAQANVASVNWINSTGQNAVTELNKGNQFVTNFKGVNDLKVTELSGHVSSLYTDNFGGSTPGNNPTYLSNYSGNSTQGTGDGTLGGMTLLESSYSGPNSLQFDFGTQLNAGDRFVLADIDYSEQIQITAYAWNGTAYVKESLAGWTEQSFSGQTGITPNSSWANWNPTTGTFTAATTANLNEALNILIPDANVDRIVITKLATISSASTEFQFLSNVSAQHPSSPVPEPESGLMLLVGLPFIGGFVRRKQALAKSIKSLK